MNKMKLQKILKSQIPLSSAMGIKVVQCSAAKGVVFRLPLRPNRNHKNTAFGGTLIAAQALASWAWLMCLLAKNNSDAQVVVQRQMSEFLAPVTDDFWVQTRVPSKAQIKKFIVTLKKKGKARLLIQAEAKNHKKPACIYAGEYVAIQS
jgi:thioesterase domain-containing protein